MSAPPAHLSSDGCDAPDARLQVTCLCADWCGTCRDYRAVFDDLARALPDHHWRWVDIEDEAELAGDVDIETFPTLLISRRPVPGSPASVAADVLFAGPVLPRAADTQRLLASVCEAVRAGRRLPPLHLPDGQRQAFETLARRLAAA